MIKSRFGEDVDGVVLRVLPFLKRVSVSPDILTLAGVGVSAVAAVAFAMGHLVTGGLVMLLSGAFDLVDGVVARQQGRSSRAGAFLDSSMDRVADLLVLGGIAVGMAARADAAGVALVCWATAGSVMTSYARARAEVDLDALAVGLMERAERCVVLIVGAVTGYLVPALWIVAIGSSITAIQRMVVAHRRLAALGFEEAKVEESEEVRLSDAG